MYPIYINLELLIQIKINKKLTTNLPNTNNNKNNHCNNNNNNNHNNNHYNNNHNNSSNHSSNKFSSCNSSNHNSSRYLKRFRMIKSNWVSNLTMIMKLKVIMKEKINRLLIIVVVKERAWFKLHFIKALVSQMITNHTQSKLHCLNTPSHASLTRLTQKQLDLSAACVQGRNVI
jgi:hypothetical protein